MKKSLKAILVALTLGTIAGFAGATFGKQEAVAMPCCSECDDSYYWCVQDCNGDQACIDACGVSSMRCYRYCSSSC